MNRCCDNFVSKCYIFNANFKRKQFGKLLLSSYLLRLFVSAPRWRFPLFLFTNKHGANFCSSRLINYMCLIYICTNNLLTRFYSIIFEYFKIVNPITREKSPIIILVVLALNLLFTV